MQPVKITVLADLHYDARALLSVQRGDLAAILLLRALQRLNRFVKPDLTVVLGDLTAGGQTPGAAAKLDYAKTMARCMIDEIYAVAFNPEKRG